MANERVVSREILHTIHLKGDIIITDPCYLVKSKKPDDEYLAREPKPKDFGLPDPPIEDENVIRKMIRDSLLDIQAKIDAHPEEEKAIRAASYVGRRRAFLDALQSWHDEINAWHACGYGYCLDKLGITQFVTEDTLYGDWSCTVFDNDNKPLGRFCADSSLVTVCLLDEVRKHNPDIDQWIADHEWCAAVIKGFDGTVKFIKETAAWESDSDFECCGKILWHKGDTRTDETLILEGEGNIPFKTSQTGF